MDVSERAELARILAVARDIAREAGDVVRAGWRAGGAVREKAPADFVTEYDLRSEELVRRRLGEAFPDHAVIGEERGASGVGELVWHVDPLDGTTNFAHGHPFFAVSLGLCLRGEPIVGAIVAPALGHTWSAARGLGATCDGRPCQVAATTDLAKALGATSFPYDRSPREQSNFRQFAAFYRRTHGVRRCGASAIDLAMTADGTYGFYWGYELGSWDAAAGSLMVTEAGGRVTGVRGEALRPPSGAVLASNGHLHAQVLGLLADLRNDTPPRGI